MSTPSIDPMTFSVLVSRLDSIQREMVDALIKSARSNAMAMARDVSTSIHNANGLLVQIGDVIPVQTMGTTMVIQSIIEDFGDEIAEGDCFLVNSPFRGNPHLGDMCVAAPVFYDGEIVFWVASKAHQIDSGSALPTNVSGLLENMYAEGIHVPPVRIHRNYQENRDVRALLTENVRYAPVWYGDLLAQIGATRVGEQRTRKLCEEYGTQLVLRFIDEYFSYAEKLWRQDMDRIPDGVAYSEDEADADQFGDKGLVKCRVEKKGHEIVVDFTGSSPQLKSGFNATYGGTFAGVMGVIFTITDRLIPHNQGVINHVELIVPRGTCLNAEPPAGTSVGTTYMVDSLMNALWKAFVQLVPERASAGWGVCGGHVCMVSGMDRRVDVLRKEPREYGHMFFLAMSAAGGNDGHDGRPLVIAPNTMGASVVESVEVHEYQTPHLIERFEMVQDSAGPGKWRGGLGNRFVLRPLYHDMTAVSLGNYHFHQPFGALGGRPGQANYHCIIDAETQEQRALKGYEQFVVREDQRYMAQSNGGGGYGDPLERDPERVRNDAREEFISLESARNDYGVVLDVTTEKWDVDLPATRELRRKLRAAEKAEA